MRDQFDNYEKRIMEKLDREAEEIERRIGEDPQVAEAKADSELDRKVYAGVDAFEKMVARRNGSGVSGVSDTEKEDIAKLHGLSDEDREALRLGRELQRRLREDESRKETSGKNKKYAGMWKRIAAAVAVLVLVAGVGVNGVGGPNRIVEIMKQAVGGREMSQGNNSTDDAKISGKNEESEAYQQIKDELGIDPVKVFPVLKKMRYIECEINSVIREAQMLYEYNDKNISYLIGDSYTEELWGTDVEDGVKDVYSFKEGRLDAEITEYELPDGEGKQFSAEFEYRGVYYQLTGCMSWADFKIILKNLHFPA